MAKASTLTEILSVLNHYPQTILLLSRGKIHLVIRLFHLGSGASKC